MTALHSEGLLFHYKFSVTVLRIMPWILIHAQYCNSLMLSSNVVFSIKIQIHQFKRCDVVHVTIKES